ncbi:MAG TPA: LacI family DNA-binding transcriptional regulator [Chloroflexota bacterium]|nr:LacI family DNA-binding transcriptional regulator [Chloroflexota bacterium]
MATIYDVARAAGVTAATVSVALSGRGVVNPKTRERVLQCARELDYRPNLVARSLTTRRTHTIGLVVFDITNPFYAEVAQAVELMARPAGYRVIIGNATGDESLSVGLLEELAARQVDGIIAISGGLPGEAVQAIAATGLPIIPCLWDEQAPPFLTPSVSFDFAAGGRLVADHLLDLGHQRIAIVAIGSEDEPVIRLREAAFRDRLAERGYPLDPSMWRWADSTLDSGYTAAHEFLSLAEPPTAIYATNDRMALGVIAAARERRVPVPQALSVVGFDDIALARYASPPLTTVRIEKTALMVTATDLLLRLIAGEEVLSPMPLPPTLVVRESTAFHSRISQPEGR